MVDQSVGVHCTGCTACKNICPKGAISMEADKEGFHYPKVNYELCIKCGLCEQRCPIISQKYTNKYMQPDVYAAWNLDSEVRISSTSGGVFSALAEVFLKHGGYVVGAVYDEDFSIYHEVTNSIDRIPLLKQSKYAQSMLKDVFIQIRELLREEKMVLFCGTPCQSAGLQKFLGKSYVNLYCCDFICRGVISQKVYHKFLSDMAKKTKTSVSNVHFKNKDYGWNQFSTKLTFKDGSVYHKDRNQDYYMLGYLKHNLYLRPSCHECRFKTIPRNSDISLGDFWGIGNYKSELDNNKGTSVVLINSTKGHELFEWASDKLFAERRTLDEVLKGNACLLNVAEAGKYREYFFANIDKVPFDTLIKKIDETALGLSYKEKILRMIYNIKEKLVGYAKKK